MTTFIMENTEQSNSSLPAEVARNNTTTITSTMDPYVINYTERVVVACMYLMIFICGTIGNSMVIIAVMLSRKLRSPTNCLITNLACSDLLTCTMLIWNCVALLSKDGWPLGDWVCTVAGTVIYTSSGTSLYCLAIIALNRLIKITKDHLFGRIFTSRNVRIMIAMTWIIPIPLILIPPLIGIGAIGYDTRDYTCSDLEMHPKSGVFNYYQSAVVPIPLFTIIICYALILKHVRRHFTAQKLRRSLSMSLGRKPSMYQPREQPSFDESDQKQSGDHQQQHKCSSPSKVANGGPHKLAISAALANMKLESPPTSPRRRSTYFGDGRIDSQQLEVTMNLAYVVMAFLLCSVPYFLALLLAAVTDTDHFMVYAGAILLASSAINPVIYANKHPHFKVVLKAMITCRYHDIPQPSIATKRVIIKNSLELPSSSFHSRSNSKSIPTRPGSQKGKRESTKETTS